MISPHAVPFENPLLLHFMPYWLDQISTEKKRGKELSSDPNEGIVL